MRPGLCRSCLAYLLKLLNFFQAFFGFTIIIYSVWILTRCEYDGFQRRFSFDFDKLPAPWFVCALMGVGSSMCLIATIGHCAAEATSGCCLCFYSIFATVFILLEAALVGDLLLNRQWEKDLPYDSTGELKRLRAFIEENMDVFKWVAMTVVVIQALSLLLAIVLRAMIPERRVECDSDEDFLVIRTPFLNHQVIPTPAPNSVENTGYHPVIWSSQMQQSVG
ncbi:hypothetical protein J5N97_028782 [Dioscorea zingiberensis]|uniref:Uncharacterized protein n=1 Tax=Dioscorea zingiberensis TaxID=325984 RepID=A0A9D5H566_9LILI|nr:hypothetical protein J5N97_028782 [Dioscorea zingiberensis]